MNCSGGYANCFLRVALMYQPSCLLPCCQGKPGGTCKKTVIQTSKTVHFVSWYLFFIFPSDGSALSRFSKNKTPLEVLAWPFRGRPGKVNIQRDSPNENSWIRAEVTFR